MKITKKEAGGDDMQKTLNKKSWPSNSSFLMNIPLLQTWRYFEQSALLKRLTNTYNFNWNFLTLYLIWILLQKILLLASGFASIAAANLANLWEIKKLWFKSQIKY